MVRASSPGASRRASAAIVLGLLAQCLLEGLRCARGFEPPAQFREPRDFDRRHRYPRRRDQRVEQRVLIVGVDSEIRLGERERLGGGAAVNTSAISMILNGMILRAAIAPSVPESGSASLQLGCELVA